jgi:uncharacterized repeat protein (TIGR04042 family)
MPEMHFVVRWPEGDELRCYSPSLVVRDYLEVGRTYPIDEFVERSRTMLGIASERVKAKFGFYCSAASDQLLAIERRASSYGGRDAAAAVTVVAFELPGDRDARPASKREGGS